jgi:hypothetical protein
MAAMHKCGYDPPKLLAIDERGVQHSSPGHQFQHDYEDVLWCPMCGQGVLRHFSHDCFAEPREEPWDMSWSWHISGADIGRLREGLTACPESLNARCTCAAHARLRESTRLKSWYDSETVAVRLTDDGLPEFAHP